MHLQLSPISMNSNKLVFVTHCAPHGSTYEVACVYAAYTGHSILPIAKIIVRTGVGFQEEVIGILDYCASQKETMLLHLNYARLVVG